MRTVVYTGVNIGAYDWDVSVPSEECPASMAYNHYYKDFKPKKSDKLSFHLARQLDSLGATKIKDGFYFFEERNVVIDLRADFEVCQVILHGPKEQIRGLETILTEEVKKHKVQNDKRLAERNKKLREAGSRYRYYKANE